MTVEASLQGKTAVVTGASSGIGQAIAERLGGAGAFVYLLGRTPAAMAESKGRIEEAGGKAEAIVLDVRDSDALVAAVDRAATDTGRLDVMVSAAGLTHPGPLLDGDLAEWREMIDVNLLALLVGTKAAVEAMRRTGNGGHIVNISSTSALEQAHGVYGATKYAVNYLSQSLRNELEDDPIRVATVAPGVTATNIARNFDPEVIRGLGALGGVELDVTPGERLPVEALEGAQAALEQLIAKPSDIAEAVHFIVSQPLRLNISDMVVRPAKHMNL
jgi:NADP-dependent 3-hydroxy acid dehydrogenase YdfG